MWRAWITSSWPAWCVALALFGDVLLGGRCWMFRDAGHFYYPTWTWLAAEHRQGASGLWNPWVDLGAPMLGEAAVGYFYPPRLLWLTPLPPLLCFKWLLAAHLLWAHLGAWRAAWRCGLAPASASFAALTYAFSGAVLYLVFNPAYLFGAAWLPWAADAFRDLIERPDRRRLAVWSLVLAMMLLAGDAQTAYHAVLAAGLWWWLSPPPPADRRRRWRALGAIVGGAVLAAGLAAPQTFAARSAVAHSDRPQAAAAAALPGVARRLAAGQSFAEASAAVWRRPPAGGHEGAIYQFSIPPWQWLETLWPAVNGRWGETNTRWTSALPAEGRVWTPSLYLGLLTVLLACAGMVWRRPRASGDEAAEQAGHLRRKLTMLACCSTWASWGVYGLGYCWDEAAAALGGEAPLGPQVGGLYWWLATLAPGYSCFRYPAKWAPWTLWALSLLAAVVIHSLPPTERLPSRRWLRWWGGLAAATLVLGAAVLWQGDAWLTAVSRMGGIDFEVFGPLDATAARRRILGALGHALLVGAAAAWLLTRCPPGRRAWGLLCLTAVDLAVAHRDLLPTAADSIAAGPVVRDQQPPPPFTAPGGPPGGDAWLAAERRAELGRHPLLAKPPFRNRESIQSLTPASLAAWRRILQQRADAPPRLQTYGLPYPDGQDPPRPGPRDVFWTMRVRTLPASAELDAETRAALAQELLVEGPPDQVVVAGHDLAFPAAPPREARWLVATGRNGRLQVEVQADVPGLLVFAMQMGPGWRAWLRDLDDVGATPREAPLVRTNEVLIGVPAPPGRWEVTLQRRSPGLAPGAAVALAGWAGWGLLWRRRRSLE